MTVLVLSILVVLGYAFSYAAGVNVSAGRNARDALQRECAAQSALNYALALLRADAETGEADTLDGAWAAGDLSVTIGQEQCAIRIVDENRKLNVNLSAVPPADPKKFPDLREPLKRLLLALGGKDADYEALCAWIDPAHLGANDDIAPKQPLQLIAGLKAIPSLNPELLRADLGHPALGDVLTTHPRRINVNTAQKEVLEALWEEPSVADAILARRKDRPFRSDFEVEEFLGTLMPAPAAKQAASLLTVRSDFFTVAVSPVSDRPSEDWVALVGRADKTVQVLNVVRTYKEASQ